MSKKKVPIRYTSREFDSIRSDLINYAKRYYPDTYKDFSQASFGSLMIDTVSYVGDMLSFYLDYQVNETFLDSSVEFDNILRIAKQHGYKYQGSASTTGKVTFYALIPANSTGLGPDTRYFPILKKNSRNEILGEISLIFYFPLDECNHSENESKHLVNFVL